MLTALFFNVPAHGHVNPSLPLVAELSRRGHHVTYFNSEGYRTRVEAVGAVFQPYTTIQDDYFESQGLHGGVPQKVANALIKTTEAILPDLLEMARSLQPDYVIFDGMCPWGYYVARSLGVPAVTSFALMPPGTPSLLMLIKVLRIMLPMALRDFGAGIETNKIARKLGKQYRVPPLSMISVLSAQGDIGISYTSSYFQPYGDSASKRVHFIGWTVNDAAPDDSFSFDQVGGRRLIYVSLGTLNNDDRSFFQACIEAFGGSDHYVMMTTGRKIAPESFGTLPENIAIYSWVPQIEILKQASLFITHGGLNSVHDGLYFGVPLLLVPQQEEQTINAMRVAELGAGLLLKRGQVNPDAIRSSAARLLTEPAFQREAQHIGETLRTTGVREAADKIEALTGISVHDAN